MILYRRRETNRPNFPLLRTSAIVTAAFAAALITVIAPHLGAAIGVGAAVLAVLHGCIRRRD